MNKSVVYDSKLEDESTTIDPDLHTMDGSESNASGTNSVRNSP